MRGGCVERTRERHDISCCCCWTVCRRLEFSAFILHALPAMLICTLFTVHGAPPEQESPPPSLELARIRGSLAPTTGAAGLPGGAVNIVDCRLRLVSIFFRSVLPSPWHHCLACVLTPASPPSSSHRFMSRAGSNLHCAFLSTIQGLFGTK